MKADMDVATLKQSSRPCAPAERGRAWLVGWTWLLFALLIAPGCGFASREIILPEQISLDIPLAADLPPCPIPPNLPPRTVSRPRPETPTWDLSLDEAIRIALENSRVVRVLAGVTAVSSGKTIYDVAITNTTIDQEQARFDPAFSHKSHWNRTETPSGALDPFNPFRSVILGNRVADYRSETGLTRTNLGGGQWALNWVENPARFGGDFGPFALNPQNRSALELGYTQPLLQGGGARANLAPTVIARLNTDVSFFQYKDSVQELVRGVIEGYWNLVQARTDVWARKIQVQQSDEAFKLAQARRKTGFGSLKDEAQANVTYQQFRANLIAAEGTVLTREGALRNLLGLAPNDDRQIIPVSAPTTERLQAQWTDLVELAGINRPDLIELKLIIEAEHQRLILAENQALPRLDAVALYRWNGLTGTMPSGEHLASGGGQFTDWTLGINFSVPLGLRQGRASVRQQKLLILRDRANLEQGMHAAVHELAVTIRDLDNAYEQYLAYKETRAAALTNLKVQLAEFQDQKKALFLNVLQALNDWGNAVSSEARALLTFNATLAILERQTGTILETHGLAFSEERFRAAGPLLLRDRLYPAALPAGGDPRRYPAGAEPSENSFDLRNPIPPREKDPPPDK